MTIDIPSTALKQYDALCQALVTAKTVDQVKHVRNTAEALRAYAKQVKNRELELDAAEIRIRAERRLGEFIQKQKSTHGLAPGGQPYQMSTGSKNDPVEIPTLKELGIDKHQADRVRKFARVETDTFEALIAEWRARVQQETDRITLNILRAEGREQIRQVRPAEPAPVGEYRLLYADPPWRYEHAATDSRVIENQYPTMTTQDIAALDVPAAEDAVLYLWATSPKLAEAVHVLEAWGFSYRTCAVWDKGQMGMGYYFRQQHELLLVGARGTLPVPAPALRPASVFHARRGKHSEKPDLVYAMLEAMYPEMAQHDRIELFQRAPREGWSGWGNEPEGEVR